LTATVSAASGSPTGAVQFTLDGTVVGTGMVGNGVATYTVSASQLQALGAISGLQTVVASYGGDGSFAPSSGTTSVRIGPTQTTLSIAPTTNPTTFGEPASFDITWTEADATPVQSVSVQVSVDGVPFGSPIALTPRLAATWGTIVTTSTLPAGTHTVTASFTGDSTFAASNASATQTVNVATATLVFSGSLQVVADGTAKTVVVTTTPPDLTGVTVTYNGSSTPPTDPGTYTVVATMNNPNYQGSAQTTLVILPQTVSVTVLEHVTVIDALGVLPSAMIAVNETVHVTDNVGVLPSAMISVNETVHVADAVGVTAQRDRRPPVLTLPGTLTAEATGAAGAVVTFNVSALDAVDGSVPVICSPASGSTFAIGSTVVECSAADFAGNTRNGRFRVVVRDGTPPVLTLPGDIVVEAAARTGATVSFAVSASDIVDGTVAVTCHPPSGAMFHLGATTVDCHARDAHGNRADGTFTVTVRDTTPPIVRLPGAIVDEAKSSAGTVVRFTATAEDIADGRVPVTCVPAFGTTFPLGVTSVSCSATDASGNSASGSFTVTVRDTTPPKLKATPNVTATRTSSDGARVTFALPLATDAVDPAPTVIAQPASGSLFPVGKTTVTVTATDAAGNTGSETFVVTVR